MSTTTTKKRATHTVKTVSRYRVGITNSEKFRGEELSDENIRKIREELLKGDQLQKDIAKKYGISREIARKIKKGKMKPIDEIEIEEYEEKEDEREGFSIGEKTSIGKLTIPINVIIEVLKKINEDIDNGTTMGYPKYSKYFIEKYGMKITVDKLKNWHSGKTKLSPVFFDDNVNYSYEYYRTLLKKKA